jgi:multicomponent K+:H+ antiporter subunit D
MMNHLIVSPLLLPLLMGTVIVLNTNRPIARLRFLGISSCLAVVVMTGVLLFQSAGGPIQTYVLGDWPTPFGIVMVLDRLSAMMLFITALLALLCLAYAARETDRQGKNFHALFQFQLLGINGAFLTGDIFNLFVFFEIMLLASYGLVLHGGGGPSDPGRHALCHAQPGGFQHFSGGGGYPLRPSGDPEHGGPGGAHGPGPG